MGGNREGKGGELFGRKGSRLVFWLGGVGVGMLLLGIG